VQIGTGKQVSNTAFLGFEGFFDDFGRISKKK
jgi:hypothetical protein